jgi:hypothetical protein
VLSLVIHVLVGFGLVYFGRRSRRTAARWVPPHLPDHERAHRVRVLVRGGWACQTAGVLFALMWIPQFVAS